MLSSLTTGLYKTATRTTTPFLSKLVAAFTHLFSIYLEFLFHLQSLNQYYQHFQSNSITYDYHFCVDFRWFGCFPNFIFSKAFIALFCFLIWFFHYNRIGYLDPNSFVRNPLSFFVFLYAFFVFLYDIQGSIIIIVLEPRCNQAAWVRSRFEPQELIDVQT